MKKIITLSGISYAVSKSILGNSAEKRILNNINLELQENEITGLIGESGCGKTTLAKIISGITLPSNGRIEKNDNLDIQLLFQNSEESIHPYRKVAGILNDVSRDKGEILNICGLLGIDEKLLNQKGISLSGGERQRAALARILLHKPDLIILDEPFSAQDPDSQIQLIQLFKEINIRYNCSLLIISHTIAPIKNLTDSIYVMLNGSIIESGETSPVFDNPFHPYTDFLLKAESYNLTREEIKGNNESAGNGCAFYNNCTTRKDHCLENVTISNFEKRMVVCNNPLEKL